MVAIIDSGGANIGSVKSALNRIGAQATLTADPVVITQAPHVILPGVGSARHAMETLDRHGLVEVVKALRQPVLGICLGMQLLFEGSDEGNVECLGIIPGRCKRFSEPNMIVPHMGWNQLVLHPGAVSNKNASNNQSSRSKSQLLDGIESGDWTYFVHSYYAPLNNFTIASCEYGHPFSAIIQRDNFFAAQFHPERSSRTGAGLLENFLNL